MENEPHGIKPQGRKTVPVPVIVPVIVIVNVNVIVKKILNYQLI